jgi:WD40 repeat protein
LYATDSNTDTVLQLNGSTGATINSAFASAGDAAGLVFGPTGKLFVVSSSTPGQLNVLNGMTGATITTVDAGGILQDPEGITLGPDGNLYVAGGDGDNVLEFDGKTGAFIKTVVTTSACPSGTPNCLMSVRGVAFGPDGNLYITSFDTNTIWQYNISTGALTDFAGATGACSALFFPRDPAFGPNGNLFVTSYGSGDVFEYNGSTGACVGDFVPAGTGDLAAPTFLLFSAGTSTGTVPEPSSLALLFCGIVAVTCSKKRAPGRQNPI